MQSLAKVKLTEKVSNEDIENILLQRSIEKYLLKAEEDIEKGRVRSAREVFKEWKTLYGI